jgi:hypothetical protein
MLELSYTFIPLLLDYLYIGFLFIFSQFVFIFHLSSVKQKNKASKITTTTYQLLML